MKGFRECRDEGALWITLADWAYYPDTLEDACRLYEPVQIAFGRLLHSSESSISLFLKINELKDSWMRIQLLRVFRKYVCPVVPVEMLKVKSRASEICEGYGHAFREISEVRGSFDSRPVPDEALSALLWEYKDRGKKGYDLTEKLFSIIREKFPDLEIWGPERAGKDIELGEVFLEYPNPKRPVDFIIGSKDRSKIYAVGLARYDSDRGGAREDDRTGGYTNCADEILRYAKDHDIRLRLIFLNDGPGLLLGSMWSDYSDLEERWNGEIMVLTLKMIETRLTEGWITGEDAIGDGDSD